MKTSSKSELVGQVAELRSAVNRLEQEDQRMRQEFSKLFGFDDGSPYGKIDRIGSWFEIFAHIGKLLKSWDMQLEYRFLQDEMRKLEAKHDALECLVTPQPSK